MDLSTLIALGSMLIAGIAVYHSWSETSRIKSNCIATLTKDVEEIKGKLDDLKVDAVLEKFNHISEQLKNGCERFNNIDRKLETQHDEVLELKIHTDSFLERLSRLYTRMDNFELGINKRLKEKEN